MPEPDHLPTHLDPESLIRAWGCVPHAITRTPETGVLTTDTLSGFADLLKYYDVPVIYYQQVTVPEFSGPVPPELTARAGEVMEVTLHAPIPGVLLTVTVWTDWADATDTLIDAQANADRHVKLTAFQERVDAFERRLRDELPRDAEFVRIARSRRPPITLLRQRLAVLYPEDRTLIAHVRTTMLEIVTSIRSSPP